MLLEEIEAKINEGVGFGSSFTQLFRHPVSEGGWRGRFASVLAVAVNTKIEKR